MRTKAAAYVRVSTIEQASNGLSLAAQRDLLKRYAEEHEMEIVEIYADEGVSAAKSLDKRTQILRLIADAEKHRFSVILFKDITRWSRNSAQYFAVQDRLDKAGVSWIAVEQPYLETVTPTGRFQVSVMLGTAQLEADQTGQRIKFVQEAEIARGNFPFPSHCAPTGYRSEKVDGAQRLVIDEKKREEVVAMFDEFLKIGNLTEVGRIHGKSTTSMARILRNRVYIGEFRGIEGFCTPIIGKEEFDRAQALIRHHAYTPSKHKGEYIFSGLCRCADCGKTMRGLCPDDKYFMYQCKSGCHNTITQREVERQVLALIEPELNRYKLTVRENKNAYKQAVALKKRFEGKIERLKELFIDGVISRAEFDKRKAEYERTISEIEIPASRELPQHWRGLYDMLTPSNKNVLWKSVVDHIVVNHGAVSLAFEPTKVLAERMAMLGDTPAQYIEGEEED